MDEKTIRAIDAQGDVADCAVTEYVLDRKKPGGSLVLTKYNFVAPLERDGAPVTSSPDANVARDEDHRDYPAARSPLAEARKKRRQAGAGTGADHRRKRGNPGARKDEIT